MTALGAKLKELRTQRQLSLREAARALGLNHTRLRDLEVGVVHGTTRPAVPTLDQLNRIAAYYAYPADVLAGLAGYPTEPPAPIAVPTPQDVAAKEIEDIFRRLRPELQAVMLDMARAFRRTLS